MLAHFSPPVVYGGKDSFINNVPADATAFGHRDAFLVYQLYAFAPGSIPPFPSDGIPFVTKMAEALAPKPSGAYPNYIDPTLTQAEWPQQYFGAHVDKLNKIKGKFDRHNMFKFDQGFPSKP